MVGRTFPMHAKLLSPIIFLSACLVLLSGCQTRSISDSGYKGQGWYRYSNPEYKGELTEMDILGAAPKVEATTENITKMLKEHQTPHLVRGDKLLLIQSGAPLPDHAMMDEMGRNFAVIPFSGVPQEDRQNLSNTLRLRAAQGGVRYLLCYWGVLESAQEDKEGKVVSWVPIIGAFVPDQKQRMRIRLRGLLMDVATGHWEMIAPQPREDEGFNSRVTRASSDQKLVEQLKTQGYKTLVSDLLKG